MPLTTCLRDDEATGTCDDPEIEELLVEARGRTGRNWRVATVRWTEGRWWWRREIVRRELCVFVDGVLPWQVITAASFDNRAIVAWLYGYLSGFDDAAHPWPSGGGEG